MSTPQNPQSPVPPEGQNPELPNGPDMAAPDQQIPSPYPPMGPQAAVPQPPQGMPAQQPQAPMPQGMPPQFPQGMPPQGPPQQPYGAPPPYGQPGYVPGAPNQQFGMAAPQPKKSNVKLIVIVSIVALAVLAFVVAYATGMFGKKSAEPASSSSSKTEITATKPEDKAVETVEKYLNAVAEGRAEDALALVDATNLRHTELLTADALKDSLARAPITDIKVTSDGGYGSTYLVKVTYSVGGNPVSDSLTVDPEVVKISKDSLPTLRVYGVDGLPLKVNGTAVSISTDGVPVFPGSYSIAPDNQYLTLTGDTEIVVASSDNYDSVHVDVAPSEAGITLFREKVGAEVRACIAQTTLEAGCGLTLSGTLSDGTTLAENSIVRSMTESENAKLDSLVPTVDYNNPMILKIEPYELPDFDVEAQCTETDGTSGTCEVWGYGNGFSFAEPSIDLSEADPKVTWTTS